MTWSVQQTRRFSRQYKKLQDNTAADVDAAVVEVGKNPEIGERKKGDLAALRVLKFRSGGPLYLLGYTLDEEVRLIYLEAVGPHENFYRDLKR
ncbi:MAG: type II toxin-antitoxin system RelE/ParE family toxin [Sulfurimicrobium sp.]|nr:type II toxin-antitoxin system RelE/ParE family toxin [Sulfurimicrobium sp.]MDP1705898.1 type II toxin-antitoxin system RelE/ParE family toxin [Sulfurimicrobium sp.]MDP2199704.1 type II toxin-antitoxin system RelE/ParE family toxin [Sulfurimicrobium sp.]MDP3687083.1 type II toxin-antitoxin system RelE/ParE family toxin [Sulfurimicrobium sp.]